MKIRLRCSILLCLLVLIYPNASLDGSKLATELEKIKKEIGVEHIQDVFNNLPYQTIPEKGEQLKEKIQERLDQSLLKLDDVLKNVKNVLNGDSAEETTRNLPLCCELQDSQLKYNAVFRKEVDTTTACITESTISASNPMYPTVEVSNVMEKNYKNDKNVLWQRFSTTEGVSIVYPATKAEKWHKCKSYDPRFTSSYAAAAYPKEKDVVIVLDISETMKASSGFDGNTKFILAREAAYNVIQTLTPNDRVGILTFNSDTMTPSGPEFHECYKSELSLASKTNFGKLKDFIFSIKSTDDDQPNFDKALKRAFKYFESLNGTADFDQREQIILFITAKSEQPSGNDPVQVISDENAKFNNRIRIFTYLLKEDDGDTNVLKNMADQTKIDLSKGPKLDGHYEAFSINQLKKLSPTLATFYLHLPKEQLDHPTFSVPYVDPHSGKGLITSLCIPVDKISSNELRGVICTDVNVGELLRDVEFFSDDKYSYAFIIDGTGRVLMHPLLPNAAFVTMTPVLVDVSVLERATNEENIQQVITSMKNGGTGNQTFKKAFIKPRGNLVNDGIDGKFENANLYWGPVPRSNFSLCVVIVDQSSEIDESRIDRSKLDLTQVFMFHNRTLVRNEYEDCKFYKRKVTLDHSCVKFTQAAFENPFEYIDREVTAQDIALYTKYLTGETETNENPALKPTVRPSIWATYKAEQFWKRSSVRHVSWRYMAMKAGFVRIFPGVSLQKTYDHEKRTWWRLALSHPGKLILTTPYVDAWGSGIVLSVIHTIFKRDTKTVTATVGADLPLEYFNWFMNEVYPECKQATPRCMIVDDSGFIVMHPRLKDTKSEAEFKEPKHITVEEPLIAKKMMGEGLLTDDNDCQDLSENIILKSFRVKMRSDTPDGLVFGEMIEIRPVKNTNVFIIRADIIKDKSCCDETKSPDVVVCSNTCGCLCHKPIQYDVCSNSYSQTSILPCSSRIPDTSGVSDPDVTTGLKACFTASCSSKQTQTDCYSETECSWCEFTSTGKDLLKNPCCRSKEQCTFGKVKSEYSNTCDATTTIEPVTPDKITGGLTEVEKTAAIAGSCLAAGILLTIISIGLYRICKKNRLHKDQADPYLSAIPGEELKDYCHTREQEQFDEPIDEPFPGSHQVAEPNPYINPGLQSST